MIEMMVVLVIMGVLMAIAFPKTQSLRQRSSLRSAKQQFGSYLAVARAAAIRQSSQAQFYIAGNVISATVTQASGSRLTIGNAVDLGAVRGVTITLSGSAPNDSVIYDARGMETVPGAARTYVFQRNTGRDSICVSKLGLIARFCGQ
jgi:prepilin-type N-terminal cleavage/methylation domain-containing protein